MLFLVPPPIILLPSFCIVFLSPPTIVDRVEPTIRLFCPLRSVEQLVLNI